MKHNDILRIFQKEREELVERHNISALSVFGSVARGDAREDNHVDILVEFSHPVGLFQFIEFQQSWKTSWDARWIWEPRARSSHESRNGF